MTSINEKLAALQRRLEGDGTVTIMIMGLGSVGCYLLDYLVSAADPRMHIIVAGRDARKMQQDVNIVRTAATIRRQMRCRISVVDGCDLDDIDSVADVLRRCDPDFLVNTSRVCAGLKYGSISWHRLRAYGIWTPLSIRYARNIMEACARSGCRAITINTSYSDAVIPWLKSAGGQYFDFGSGNLNHLIPRMRFHIAGATGRPLEDIDITLAASHFHDVVISKEGHSEGQRLLLAVDGRPLEPGEQAALLAGCKIPMPVDQKRNMMNASSNYDIIMSVIGAIDRRCRVKIHTPGVDGEIGGYPYVIDASGEQVTGAIDTSVFGLEEMRQANRRSIYPDGIADVSDSCLHYTPELVEKVRREFGVDLPPTVAWDDIDRTGAFIIDNIIKPSL